MTQNIFCIHINFDNPLKVCFFNDKYITTIQTPLTQIVISILLIENCFYRDFKDFWRTISHFFRLSI